MVILSPSQLVSNKAWMPKDSGRKAQSETFLGPFLATSGFMDESVPVRSRYVTESFKEEDIDTLESTIQSTLAIIRVSQEERGEALLLP